MLDHRLSIDGRTGGTSMKQSVVAMLLLASVPAGAAIAQEAAHDPLITWTGSAVITKMQGASCADTGFNVGSIFHSVYRPNLDPAEPPTAVTLVHQRSAVSFFRSSGNAFMNGAGNYTGSFIGGRATIRPNSNAGAVTGAYKLKVIPGTFTAATTTNVDISGTFTNFFGHTGCTITFNASYQRRP